MKMRQDFKLGFRIFSLVSILLLIIHWLGCVLYIYVGDKETSYWLPPFDLNWQVTEFYDITNDKQYLIMYYYGLINLVGNEMAPTTFG